MTVSDIEYGVFHLESTIALGHADRTGSSRVDLRHNPYYYSHYYRREYGEYFQKQNSA